MTKQTTLFLLLFLPLSLIYGQNQFTLKPLPSQPQINDDYVRKIFSDTSGIIWMRTFSRILRFNGSVVENFDNIIPKDFGLRDAYMLPGRILLNYNDTELRIFDIQKLTLTNIITPEELGPISNIYYLDENHIYISNKTQRKVQVCKLLGSVLVSYVQHSNIEVDNLVPINDSLFLFCFKMNCFLFNSSTKAISLFQEGLVVEDYIIRDSIISILSSRNFRNYDFKNNKFISDLSIPNNEDGHYVSFSDSKLWLFTNAGIYVYDRSNNLFNFCDFILGDANYPFKKQSYDIYFIRDGNYYLLTNYSGLYKVIKNSSPAFHYYNLKSNFKDNNEVSLRCIYYNRSASTIYTSVDSRGLFTFKLRGDFISLLSSIPTDKISQSQTSDLNKIFMDDFNRIWFCGNYGLKIDKLSIGNESKLMRIWDVSCQKKQYWTITNRVFSSFLILLDEKGVQLKTFEFFNGSNSPNQLWDIEPYGHYLFISSVKGLITFDIDLGQFVSTNLILKTNINLKGRAWSCKVMSNNIYIAFQDIGIIKINLKTGESSNPLPGIEKAFQIEAVDGNSIWINALDKLIYLNENGTHFILNTNNFGLPSAVSFHGIFSDSTGNLWVCGKDGFAKVDIIELFKHINSTISRTSICGFSVNNKMTYGYLSNKSSIILPYDSNIISIDLANNLLDKASDLKMRYKLNGFDIAFTEVENTNNITYRNLPYGNYSLDIFMCNSFGIWDETSTQLFIKIRPPWYYSPVAKITYMLIFAGILVGFYFLFMRRTEIQKKHERLLIESELKGIRAQLNPHFLFNSLNSIQSHILNRSAEVATTYLNQFAKLLRRVLDYSTAESIPFCKEIDWIKDYFELESVRFKDKFQWNVVWSDEIDVNLHIPALVIQPIIENAIIHGLSPLKKQGCIDVSYILNEDKKSITCRVEDNGVGRTTFRNPLTSHSSKGTLMTQLRLYYLSKKYHTECTLEITDLKNLSGEPTGTLVVVILPLINSSSAI